jgi:hypothetical protein
MLPLKIVHKSFQIKNLSSKIYRKELKISQNIKAKCKLFKKLIKKTFYNI